MSQLGHNRERQVRHILEAEDYWVARAAGSLGDADLVALKAVIVTKEHLGTVMSEALLVESKANADGGPYMNFRPKDRAELLAAAELAGAEAWLCHWPSRRSATFIPSEEWPEAA